MKMEQRFMYRDHLIFVAGTICSGKSFEAAIIADSLDYDFVEISSIVREILDTNKRDNLQGHPELSTQIIDRIIEIRRTTRKMGVVVSGPRQVEILQAFPLAETIWMNTPMSICFDRFCKRKDTKDKEFTRDVFEDYLLKDDELGLQEVKQFIEKNKYEKN
tara:strand:+ start:26 stop:508 length:483 start_codon:yes stop_codon:yes gene_type:complete